MLENVNISDILFLDIETVPAYSDYGSAPENIRKLWDKKAKHLQRFNEDSTS